MLTTIKLNNNFLFKGYEVYDVCFNRLLPAELDTFKLACFSTGATTDVQRQYCCFSTLWHTLGGYDVVSWSELSGLFFAFSLLSLYGRGLRGG